MIETLSRVPDLLFTLYWKLYELNRRYLLFVGIKSIKTRVIYLPKLFIIPLILLAIKYKTLLSDDALVFCLVIMGGSIASFFINTGNTLKVIKKRMFN